MTVNLNKNEIMLRCECGTLGHMAVLTYEPDDSRGNNLKAVDDYWYLSIALSPYLNWAQRLGMAFRYIFGINYSNRAFDEIVLKKDDMVKLQSFIVERIQ